MPLPRLWQLAQRSLRGFLDDNCPQMAAAISYYGLFSLFRAGDLRDRRARALCCRTATSSAA